jgi:cycloeucalenol cycloisomerase
MTMGMQAPVETSASPFDPRRGWFSENPDKAWGEKFFLSFLPIFLIFNEVMIQKGWLETGNFWNVAQNFLLWVPYCILLPAYLRRNSGVAWYQSYWLKFNVFIFFFNGWLTYFGTEWFYQLLGFHYNYPKVTWHFYSYVCGPGPGASAVQHKLTPLGVYLSGTAFFIIYHTLAQIFMRRIKFLFSGSPVLARQLVWIVIVGLAAWFFGWAEPKLFNGQKAAQVATWYDNLPAMLKIGALFYALDFICSFPTVFQLDEYLAKPRWSAGHAFAMATTAAMGAMFLGDLWGWIVGPIT